MAFSGSQIAGNIGLGGDKTSSGPIKSAISSVTKALTDSRDDTTDAQKSNRDEVAAAGKEGEQKNSQLLTADHSTSRLKTALASANNLGLGLTSPAAGMFGPRLNPYASLFPGGFGGAASGNGWGGAAVANINPNYNGPGGGNDPAGGGYMGSPNDHIFEGKEKPNNITFLGSSNSGSNAYGWNGTAIANVLSTRISRGESLGAILNDLDGKPLQTGDQFQTPHLTTTGSGLTVSYGASTRNQVTGTGIILLGGDGSGEYHVGLDQGAQKIYDSMKAIGLTPYIVHSQEEMEARVKQADQDALNSGGKQLVWLHVETHGNSDDQSGGHNPNAIGGVSAGGKMIHENAIIAALAYGKGHTDKLGTTGSCHGGAIDANQFFDYLHQLDSTFRLQPSKQEAIPPNNPAESKQPDQRTSSVDKPADTKDTTTLIADNKPTDAEKRKQQETEDKLTVEIS